ncbi:magnesium-translocating P-type ATPase [Mixta tenebrionis]|uniref:Magnesium-transporting ATPase, P-type 1 n=1 Tax=Mixta tenebrionis TaxID=2562439 RepID=A0A506VF11_9GAMM|nr:MULTISPECIES: magnesium-translocating P-type ATPase [Mixta]QHM76661.1 Magnesium-transporting ATPase, P-type 1 [Mixta theicola]TPW43919.1 magnesium-translocating P-type ATPase [Mixta tenebrionis]
MTQTIKLAARQRSAAAQRRLPIGDEAGVSAETTLLRLQSDENGLTCQQVAERQARYGANQIATERAPHPLRQLLLAFNNPFIYVLLGLSAISFFTDYWLPLRQNAETDLTGIAIMLTMVLLSALLRFWQEFRNNKAADTLRALVTTRVSVRRRTNNHAVAEVTEVTQQELVPGDIILLAAGDIVPADSKLIATRDLLISQSALSGEALPVEKSHRLTAAAETQPFNESALFNAASVCLMGTHVVSGAATAVVVATGNRTWFGSMARRLVGERPATAFDRGVNSVSWLLIKFMALMVPVVLVLNGFSKGDWLDATLFALAVAVGLTPEMLPMIVSTNLAKGAIAMARRKVVVKRLEAIQNLGAMDLLCTDKTGTLTEDRIVLDRHLDLQGNSDDAVLALAWLNSKHQSSHKNLMDRAVLRFARRCEGLPQHWRKIDELPFDFERRRLSVLVADERGEHHLICKGALEEMLAVSTHLCINGQRLRLDEEWRNRLRAQSASLNEEGYRVLLIGQRETHATGWYQQLTLADERELTLYGMLTFLDPAKESAAAAIRALQQKGVQIKVLTGDNPTISRKICRDVGLTAGEPLLGEEIERLDDTQLAQRVTQHTLFARLTPTQKARIVGLLQQQGHTVGFLGDGVNDAAALRAADVGISVDGASDMARQAAGIILLEKSLLVLEQGVIAGRQTFGNIIKYLNITASSNFGNVFSVLVASAFIPFLPMLAIQLLLQNLIYDVAQLALPWDRMDKSFLQQPRKWDARNIGRFMLWMGPLSSIFDITTFALMWYVFGANGSEHQALFQSGWFVEGLLSQTLVVHMLRTRHIPFVQACASLPVMLATLAVVIIGITLPFSPLAATFGLQALPLSYFPWLVITLLGYCLLSQGVKALYIRRYGEWF